MLFEKIREAVLSTLNERTSDIKNYIERENLNINFTSVIEFRNNAKVEMIISINDKGDICSRNNGLEFIESTKFITSLSDKEKSTVSNLLKQVYILNDELRIMF